MGGVRCASEASGGGCDAGLPVITGRFPNALFSVERIAGVLIDMRLYAGLENVEGVGANGGDKTVIGNALNNRIAALNDAEDGMTLIGGDGDDTLMGGHGDDSLDGGDGNDYLDGNFGDDTLVGGAGTDTVDGGPGNNTITSAEITPSAPNIRIASRVLIADGSWGRDLITIERTGGDDVIVRVNNTSRTFDMDDFDGVLLRGNAGHAARHPTDRRRLTRPQGHARRRRGERHARRL